MILALCLPAFGQQPQTEEEVVRLSPFAVTENANIGRYQAAEATSGTRVRMDLMDSTQSISVVTNEFMQDIGTDRLLDAVKYVAGIGASTQPNALDAMNVRGFTNYGATIDGFSQFNWVNQDPIVVERIEIVKGPNAIIAPQGLPGGVVNNVTKRPLFTNKGYVSYQIGRWDANRAAFDGNYVVRPDKLAVRVVGAVTDADDYGQDEFHQNITMMPMLTYRLSPTTEFTIQLQAYNASVLANNGNPISVYAVGRSNVRLQEGLPRNFQMLGRNITRHQNGQNTRFFFTSQITDKLSTRLVGNWVEQSVRTNFLGVSRAFDASGAPGEVVLLDPITGEWSWDGVTLNNSPRYNLGGANEWPKLNYGNLQNDFVYEHSASTWKSQSVGGYAVNYNSQHQRIKNYTADPTLYDFSNNFTPPPYTLEPNWRDNWSSRGRSTQVYIYEVLSLFEDRLVLSGSLSQNRYYSSNHDNLTNLRSQNKGEATLPSGGLVYKITPEVSAYYGFSKQELLGGSDEANGIPPHTVPSRQHEGGVRIRLFDGKLYATLAYFDIMQSNLYQQNFANYVTPRPVPPLPPVLTQRTSKGFEFELSWSPTKNFSMVGSYTDYKNRDQDNMRYTNVPEKMASIWGQYTFSDTGALRGLAIGIGASYTGERPSDTIGQYTEPPAGYTPVRIQPSFWIPSYTVVEASASYRFNKYWRANLVIKNLLDKDYIPGSFNRNIYVSTPINPKLTLRYEF
ncbi:hypothetical protein AXK11_07480 [Cephaloticoccus primus]|uniref:TonB-dependent receptor plug domain-containing protein n=1 Tax=Cephaloticoccus primus TaxID=1548207 RepID=A0A139SK92_9BACT|nr:hypothetical protein AXK11_07480 [Cephaloticoccus primus]